MMLLIKKLYIKYFNKQTTNSTSGIAENKIQMFSYYFKIHLKITIFSFFFIKYFVNTHFQFIWFAFSMQYK